MLSLISVMMTLKLSNAHPHEILQWYRRETADGKPCETWADYLEPDAEATAASLRNICVGDISADDFDVNSPDPWEYREGQPGCIAERDWYEVQHTVLACDIAPVWENMEMYCPGKYSGEFGESVPDAIDLEACAEACADSEGCLSFMWNDDVENILDVQCKLSYECDLAIAVETADGWEGWFPFIGHEDPDHPLMTVRAGCENVVFSADNTCIETSSYENEDYCLIELNSGARIVVEEFDVEDDYECSYDFLQMPNGKKYCGDISNWEQEETVPGGFIYWSTDYSETAMGWKICAEALGGDIAEELPAPTTDVSAPTPETAN